MSSHLWRQMVETGKLDARMRRLCHSLKSVGSKSGLQDCSANLLVESLMGACLGHQPASLLPEPRLTSDYQRQ